MQTKLNKKEEEVTQTKKTLAEKHQENKQLKLERDTLKAKIAKLSKELEVSMISQGVDHAATLSDHNKRLLVENQRLRDELSHAQREVTMVHQEKPKSKPATQVAYYVDNKAAVALKAGDRERKELLKEIATLNQQLQERDAHIKILSSNDGMKGKLNSANEKNKRLHEENNRLRVTVEQSHQFDMGSRFKSQNVMGRMIEGYKDAKQSTDKPKLKTKEKNETDDLKLQKMSSSKP